MTHYKKYQQLVSSPKIGDCHRACMATLLQLPPEILPNDHSSYWPIIWETFLRQFGLALSFCHNSKGPIWQEEPWIATVPSLNYKGGVTHAILMHDASVVFHDPSNKKRYKTGTRLTSDVVKSGQHLIVSDITKIHLLDEYRRSICEEEKDKKENKQQ